MPDRASILESRKLVLANGAIIHIRIWRLPEVSRERPHGLKYSLFYGPPGVRIIGYDNETGKGDHRHYRDRQERYTFVSLQRLIADFEADVREEIANG